MLDLEKEIAARTELVNAYVAKSLNSLEFENNAAIKELVQSMLYSATNGGKRFRPVLSLLVGELFQASPEKILPFATAVEYIHTYSLIHDDLPCMDNDDERRGQPTNHKVFGEAFALLAGDALLTESIGLINKSYNQNAFLALELIELTIKAAGVRGMVAGQAIDLKAEGQSLSLAEMVLLHRLKTGAMIRLAAEGAALIAGASPQHVEAVKEFGEKLGLAFQVADDILDYHEKNQTQRSFVGLLGLSGAQDYLDQVSFECREALNKLPQQSPYLEYLVSFNQKRKL